MRDTLKALEELQKVDLQIAELVKGGSENPRRLAELESQLGAGRAAVETDREKLADLEKQKKSVEDLLASDKDKVKKWEARLTEQRSPREYTALAREIDIAKKQNTTASDEIVELAKQAETARDALETRESDFSESQTGLVDEMKSLRAAMEVQDAARKVLDEKRAEAAKAVPAQTLKRYEQIVKRRSSVIVPVVSGACNGCHMNLPPQLNNQLRTNARIDVCPSCSRMIYSPEAFEKAEEN
ncbi:zinc ribbon domain-containing protein [Vulgatibacter incomptus]|uniref:Uncharacterized protein n=1 Tax=Vulgatibacter incomptus TaxID=1391653 RepID=A0A0K1PA10_9BACT|nr:C4-type zinc ribbon domain-containing protein [Vulgatibacter incomptus]AKU89954.1 Hypothetical protein AKJ08_0341 [Vulgatibacter incomptus]